MSNPFVQGVAVVRRKFKVYVKQHWADAWILQRYLKPVSSVSHVAPRVSEADFIWHFGMIKQADRIQPEFYTTTNFDNWYVAVESAHPVTGERETLWVGIIQDDQISYMRHQPRRGFQRLKAFGLEHLLDRCYVHRTWAVQNGTEVRIDTVPGFNQPARNMRHMIDRTTKVFEGNAHPNSFSDGFKAFYDSSLNGTPKPIRWTNKDICERILRTNTPDTPTFKLSGQKTALDIYERIWNLEGLTVKQALDRLISPKFGCGYYVQTTGSGDVNIYVFTMVGSDTTVGTKTLPANSTQDVYNVQNVPPFSSVFSRVPIRYNFTEKYDEVLVQGSPVKVMGNFSYQDGTLEKGWTQAAEDAYIAAAGGTTAWDKDTIRADDRYEMVYQNHWVKRNWNGKLGNGTGGGILFSAVPLTNDDGTVDFLSGSNKFWIFGMRFLHATFLKTAFDYTKDPPVDSNPAGGHPDYRPCYSLWKNEGGAGAAGEPQVGDNKWFFGDKAHEKYPYLHPIHVSPLEHEFGIKTKVHPNHFIAQRPPKSTGGAWANALATVKPELDYQKMIIVAAFETDARQHILITSPTAGENRKRLVVTIPEAEYWYVVPTTNVSVASDGTLQQSQVSVIRDDLTLLQAVAALAEQWFTVQRQAIRVPVQDVSVTASISAPLGTYITDIVNQDLRESVNSVVTSRSIDYRRGITVTETHFMSYDEAVGMALGPHLETFEQPAAGAGAAVVGALAGAAGGRGITKRIPAEKGESVRVSAQRHRFPGLTDVPPDYGAAPPGPLEFE